MQKEIFRNPSLLPTHKLGYWTEHNHEGDRLVILIPNSASKYQLRQNPHHFTIDSVICKWYDEDEVFGNVAFFSSEITELDKQFNKITLNKPHIAISIRDANPPKLSRGKHKYATAIPDQSSLVNYAKTHSFLDIFRFSKYEWLDHGIQCSGQKLVIHAPLITEVENGFERLKRKQYEDIHIAVAKLSAQYNKNKYKNTGIGNPTGN